MKLEDIGFYTLSEQRARNTSIQSNLKRCELILTDKCNFKCPYCRGLKKEYRGDIEFNLALSIIRKWSENKLENIRFSGGEPTLYENLNQLVSYSKASGIKRIALSTNGSANKEVYEQLIESGVNDFSISLDACCQSTGNIMSGKCGYYDKVIKNIEYISRLTYTTVGIVINEFNIKETEDIINLAHKLNVSDIRIIPSAQYSNKLENINIDKDILLRNKILNYRINNIKNNVGMRGLENNDSKKCYLVLDDMAVCQNYHFPCIIYMREYGSPIGEMSSDFRNQRYEWFKKHNCLEDNICRNNCLDVCRLYNLKVRKYYV